MRKIDNLFYQICSWEVGIKMSSLYFHGLMGKTEEHERKKYLMVDDYMLNKVLYKI